MPHNQFTSKISCVIGVTLLLAIIGFTIFINFFVDKSMKEEVIRRYNQRAIEKEYFLFDSTDLNNLWKLEKLQTGSPLMRLEEHGGVRVSLDIDKVIEIGDYKNALTSGFGDELPDSIRQFFSKIENNDSKKQFIVNYGTLSFLLGEKVSRTANREFKNFTVTHNENFSFNLKEIGNLFLKYKIHSIITDEEYGSFTCVELKDGTRILLMQEDGKVKRNYYYTELLQDSKYVNDSTKIFLPKL